MSENKVKVVGVGAPVVDLLLRVSEDELRKIGVEKGARTLVTPERQDEIIEMLGGTPAMSQGGSVGNVLFTLARLGFAPAMCGMVGLDMYGQFYVQEFCKYGGELEMFDYTDQRPNARCLSLITPDSERTMLTSLAAAESIPDKNFDGFDWILLEGYLFAMPDADQILELAYKSGAKLCLDLSDRLIVKKYRDRIAAVLPKVEIVFANAEEAAAFCDKALPPEKLAEELGKFCPEAVVKLGADGCAVKTRNGKIERFEAFKIEAVDTTGAGDLFQAGFMYGIFYDQPIEKCAFFGATLGSEAVKVTGTTIPAERWLSIWLKLKI